MKKPTYGHRVSKAQIERAARIYGNRQDAAAALGIHPGSFTRLCKKYGIDTPLQRQQKKQRGDGGPCILCIDAPIDDLIAFGGCQACGYIPEPY